MSTLLREGLEARLVALEDLLTEGLGTPPGESPPEVCASCYELIEHCYCMDPVQWPLAAVVYKLRAELSMDT
jgi:hypothetical protein